MPGVPTHFVILDKTIAALNASPQQPLRDIASVMEANAPFAYLGAVGPTLGDFIPSGPGLVGQYVKVWQRLFDIVGGWKTPGHPGLLNIVTSINSFLDQLDTIAAAEDTNALVAFKSQLGELNDTFGALSILLGELKQRALDIVQRINGSGPLLPSTPGTPVGPPDSWAVRDFLHWKKTGAFAKALVAQAEAANDDRFRAYAYGYIVAYAANAVGAPFVNSIVLGPYRTAWWRHRFVQNWIDAWVFGAAAANPTMDGDMPTPPYSDPAWASLCNAQLQKKLELTGVTYDPVALMWCLPKGLETDHSIKGQDPFPVLLPPGFGNFWVTAYTAAFGPPASGSPVQPGALNDAYVMTWLMLWFQTAALGCNPAPPMNPPGNCGTKPSWVDPASTTPGDNGAGGSPAPPGNYEQVNTAEEVCGWILAILGGLGVLIGGLGPGGAAIALGVTLIADAHSVDWNKLRCDLFWYRQYLFNSLDLVHSVLLLGGLDFPRAPELGQDTTTIPFVNQNYLSGANLCKSQARREGFPSKPWMPDPANPGDWTAAPTQWEELQTVAYLTAAYPSFIVDDPANPLSHGDVREPGTWPPGYRTVAPGNALPVEFGNAVANAVDLFAHIQDDYPSWNLDGDRGLAYMTWQFQKSLYTDPVAIEAET
jgi:hypothetical protein